MFINVTILWRINLVLVKPVWSRKVYSYIKAIEEIGLEIISIEDNIRYSIH